MCLEDTIASNIDPAKRILAKTVGLVKSDGTDFFANRLMFPIRDENCELVAFGGRTMDPDCNIKYMNSPQSKTFDKSNTLYNLDKAIPYIKAKGQVIITEGYTDCITAHMAGYNNVVATLGVALTSAHVKLLSKYTDTFVFAFDGDVAGKAAAVKAGELTRGFTRRVLKLPDGEDLDTIFKTDPSFQIEGNLITLKHHKIEQYLEHVDGESLLDIVQAIHVLRGHVDALIYSAYFCERYNIEGKFGIPRSVVEREFIKIK